MEADPHLVLRGAPGRLRDRGEPRDPLTFTARRGSRPSVSGSRPRGPRRPGIVGERMLGRPVSCNGRAPPRRRPASCSARRRRLLESIEGRRAPAGTRPPFPTESGLWGKPTVIKRRDARCIPAIVSPRRPVVCRPRTQKAPGPKLFGLSGSLAVPGSVEVRQGGVTLRALLEGSVAARPGGGGLQGRWSVAPRAVIVPRRSFDVPMVAPGARVPGTAGSSRSPPGPPSSRSSARLLASTRPSRAAMHAVPRGGPRCWHSLDELEAGADPRGSGSGSGSSDDDPARVALRLGQAARRRSWPVSRLVAGAFAPRPAEPRPGVTAPLLECVRTCQQRP